MTTSSATAIATIGSLRKKIVLKSVYGKTNHKLRLEPCRDGRTGAWMGVKNLSDEQKRTAEYFVQPGVTYLEIVDGYEFDLTRPKDKIDWQWVQHCPQIGVGRESTDFNIKGDEAEDFTSYEGADKEFYVFDEENEVLREEKRNSREFEALSYINDQSPSALYQVARLLGSNMESNNTASVRNFLNSKARKHPDAVLKISQNPHNATRLFLYAALDREIIRKRAGVFYYNDTPLGTTEDQALLWLGEDRNYSLVRAIKLDLQPGAQPRPTASEANRQLFDLASDDQAPAAATIPALPTFSAGSFGNDDEQTSLDDMDDVNDVNAMGEPTDLSGTSPTATMNPPTLPRAQARRQNGSNK